MSNGPKRTAPWLTTEFFENQHKFPPEELAKYGGKFIAWRLDGAAILASGDTREEVNDRLRAQGLDAGQVVWDYVDPPDLVVLGGYWTD
jgi:hypothetical protein